MYRHRFIRLETATPYENRAAVLDIPDPRDPTRRRWVQPDQFDDSGDDARSIFMSSAERKNGHGVIVGPQLIGSTDDAISPILPRRINVVTTVATGGGQFDDADCTTTSVSATWACKNKITACDVMHMTKNIPSSASDVVPTANNPSASSISSSTCSGSGMHQQQDDSFHDLPDSVFPAPSSSSLFRRTYTYSNSSQGSTVSGRNEGKAALDRCTRPQEEPHFESMKRFQAQLSTDLQQYSGAKRPRLVPQKQRQSRQQDSAPQPLPSINSPMVQKDGSYYINTPYLMSGIATPHRYNDILLGRGGGTNFHPGNVKLRAIIEKYKQTYMMTSRKEKPVVAMVLVKHIRQWNPVGRFLKKDPTNGLWYDVGDEKGKEKVSQLFREKDQLSVSNLESRLRTGRLQEILNELEATDSICIRPRC